MAESNLKDDIVEKMETSNVVFDNTLEKNNVEMNKRSRDDLSDDETDGRSTKKPCQILKTELVEKKNDRKNSIENGTAEVQHMDLEEQHSMENELKSDELSSENVETDSKTDKENKRVIGDKDVVSDNMNERRKSISKSENSKEPEVVEGLELSVECASDKDSSESEEDERDEKKTNQRSKTTIVNHTPNDSELEVSACESETSNKHDNTTENDEVEKNESDTEKTENNKQKNTSPLISKNSKSDKNSENDSDIDNHNEMNMKKSTILKKHMTSEKLKKNAKKTPGKKKPKSSDEDESDKDDIEEYDSSDDDTRNSRKSFNRKKKEQTSEKKDNQEIKKNTKSAMKKRGTRKLQNTKKNQVSSEKNAKHSKDDVKSDRSDEEEGNNGEKESGKMSDKSKNKTSDSQDSDDSNDDDDFEEKAKDGDKKRSRFEDKVAHMKKFISAAGIKVKKYDDLWLNCKTNKQKIDRLKELLEKNGVSGRPTLEKCKKAKAKREQDREIAELDPKNIISEVRVTRSRNASTKKPSTTSSRPQISPSRQQEIHKRIRYVVDSDSE